MATTEEKLDAELGRILKVAADMAPVSNELHQLQQTQSTAWPWRVPQAPSYTSDHAPKPFRD
ncbi:hypothetical protein [Bradyrhizobium sp. ERR14]|uniref:hypothetical protein n=1 Tax=Bradyrhizobium sp. ERR14 TaxID=2663837 RepID=UPI0016146492|nr:hypothetical protein [Bradyrhizobium sp. ERR14]MBB4395180.1 hypothetical protein [Bradyrhizobium sp. ERR14]